MNRKLNHKVFWICFMLTIFSIIYINTAKSEELFNESYIFSGGGSLTYFPDRSGANGTTAPSGFNVSHLLINFDNIKRIQSIKAYACWNNAGAVAYFTLNTTETFAKYVPLTAYINGSLYGYGSIGWEKVSAGSNYFYIVVTFSDYGDNVDDLIHIGNLVLEYDHTVYKNYVNPNANSNNGYTMNNAITYTAISVSSFCTGAGGFFCYMPITNVVTSSTTDYRITYTFNGESRVTLNNISLSYGFVNITKYNYIFVSKILNESGYWYFNRTDNTDSSDLLPLNNNLILNLGFPLNWDWVNKTIWSGYVPSMGCDDWDIYFNQSNYNLYDQMNITYDLMHLNSVCANFAANNYQVQLINPDYGIEDQYLINAGDRFYYWLPVHSKVKKGIYTTYLNECWKNMTRCVVLAQDTAAYGFSYSNVSGNISTDKTIYYNNQSVNITYNLTGTNSGRIIIKDDNKSVIFQKDVVSGYNQHYNFSLVNYPIGIYNVFLQHYTDFWNNLDETTFYILSNTPEINIYRDNYIFGDTLEFMAYNPTSDGYIHLFDSKNNLLSNYSINQYDLYYDIYYLKYSLPVGNYTIYMYNNTGIIAYDHTWVDASIPTTTPTVVIPTPAFDPGSDCQPIDNSLIAIPEMISCITFGKVDKNSDQVYQDSEISTFGNKIFMTLALLIFIIILLGIFSSKRR